MVAESLIWVTKVAAKAKVAVPMVKWVVAPAASTGEGREAGPSTIQESTPSLARFACWGWKGIIDS